MENSELYEEVFAFEKGRPLGIDDAVDRSNARVALEVDSSFIASRFYKFEGEILSRLRVFQSQRLLSHKETRLESEDSLLDVVIDLCEKSEQHYCLFRYVHIEHCDVDHLNRYLEHVYPKHLDLECWSGICDGLRNQFNPRSERLSHAPPEVRLDAKRLLFSEDAPFGGIFLILANSVAAMFRKRGRRDRYLELAM